MKDFPDLPRVHKKTSFYVCLILGAFIFLSGLSDFLYGATLSAYENSWRSMLMGAVFLVIAFLLYRRNKKEAAAYAEAKLEREALMQQLREDAIAETARRLTEAETERERRLAEAEAESTRRLAEAKAERERRSAEAEAERIRLRLEAEAYFQKLSSIPLVSFHPSEKSAPCLNISDLDNLTYSTTSKRSSLDKLGDFVSIDCETTGLSPSTGEIVEIAVIRFHDFEPVERFETLCKPKRGMNKRAMEINGITANMVENEVEFGRIAEALQAFIGSDNLVGHNLPFDLRFIRKYGVNTLEMPRKYYDTLRISRNTVSGIENYKLDTLAAYYGIPNFAAHSAIADAYTAAMLFMYLAKDRLNPR